MFFVLENIQDISGHNNEANSITFQQILCGILSYKIGMKVALQIMAVHMTLLQDHTFHQIGQLSVTYESNINHIILSYTIVQSKTEGSREWPRHPLG